MDKIEPPVIKRLDVLRNVLLGKYLIHKRDRADTMADHAEKLHRLDVQFRLDCARKFYLSTMEQEDDPLGPIYAKGLHLARIAHEEVAEDKIGEQFVERWCRFSYFAWQAYQIDVNEYPIPITKETEL